MAVVSLRPVTRRTFLTLIGLLAGASLARDDGSSIYPSGLPRLPNFPVDASRRRLFTPTEQVMGLYGATLPAVAASISTAPGRRGWISGDFWRQQRDPKNARIQENVATLAWFYSQNRPWNPYFGSPQLLQLINVTLSYYVALQGEDGAFPAGRTESSRAATGFALIYLSQTYHLMEPHGWDERMRQSLLDHLLKAVDWFLNTANSDVWEDAIYTSNQVLAGLLGAFMVADHLGAPRLRLLHDRLNVFLERSASPAGYLYEDRSVDFSYTISVTMSDLAMLHRYTNDDRLLETAARFLNFCTYNYLWEPDGSGFVVNGAIGSRQPVAFLDAERADDVSLIDMLCLIRGKVPMANAFVSTAEGRAALRTAWSRDPLPIPRLEPGHFDPSRPRTVLVAPGFPDSSTRRTALDSFPYRAQSDFLEERHDIQFNQHFLWVRRPTYFVSAFWGKRRGRQRSGPGCFYSPLHGTFLCAQTDPVLPWGAMGDDFDEGAMDLTGVLTGSIGTRPPALVLKSPDGRHRRTLVCYPDRLAIAYDAPGAFVEHLPLVLKPSDELYWRVSPEQPATSANGIDHIRAQSLIVFRGEQRLTIELRSPANLKLTAVSTTLFAAGTRVIRTLRISGRGRLAYDMRIDA